MFEAYQSVRNARPSVSRTYFLSATYLSELIDSAM